MTLLLLKRFQLKWSHFGISSPDSNVRITHEITIVPCESTAEGFHLNGKTIGFHPQTQKLELHTKQIVPCESTAEGFHLNGNTIGSHPQTQNLELHTE